MLIGYGYGFPRTMALGSTLASLAWDAYNTRASADGAATAEDAVSGCLLTRFAILFNF